MFDNEPIVSRTESLFRARGDGDSILQPGDELAISFTWARSRPVESAVAREIVFPGDRLPVIAEAARRYRSSMAPEEVEIRGVIVQLKADQPEGSIAGPVVVRTMLDCRTRKVQIALDPASHHLAWQAYESRAEVTCRGELVRAGNNLILQNPRGFAIVADE